LDCSDNNNDELNCFAEFEEMKKRKGETNCSTKTRKAWQRKLSDEDETEKVRN